MYSLFLSLIVVASPLRVCADPANLPFSNRSGEGFDNRIAGLIARNLHRPLDFVWTPETEHFVRKTLDANRCDVLLGVPSGMPGVLSTGAYYRSTYVFVSRGIKPAGLDDPRLQKLRIGVQIAGNDYTPPAAALARRGLAARLHGYPVRGSEMFEALRKGEIDIAVVWGPAAGYAVKHSSVPFVITAIPMPFALTAAVRKSDARLQSEINTALTREAPAIRRTLSDYGVPLL